jgi:hypothetical protein
LAVGNRRIHALGLTAIVLLVAGCAGPNPLLGAAGQDGVAGFWAGLWHGVICPVSFIISLFDHSVRIYEVHNRGSLYDLGFVIGAATAFGSGGRGSRGRGRRP